MRTIFKLSVIKYPTLLALVALSVVAAAANASLLFFVSRSMTSGGGEIVVNGILFFVALAIYIPAQTMLSRLLLSCSEHSLSHIRMTLCRLLLRSRYHALEQLGRGELWSAMTHDVMILGQIWPNLIGALVATITIVLLLAYLLVSAPRHFLAVVLLMAGGIAIYSIEARRARQRMLLARTGHDRLLDWINDMLFGLKELKLDRKKRAALLLPGLEQESASYVRQSIDAQQRLQRAATLGMAAFFAIIGLIAFAFPILSSVHDRSQLAFLFILIYLVGPIGRIMSSMGMLSAGVVSAQRISDLCEVLRDNAEAACSLAHEARETSIAPNWRKICLNQITYEHVSSGSSKGFVLGPVSLAIARGEIVFVAGANGSGKTTLAKVMTGLYYPSAGSITVDETEIDEGNIDEYRELFAVIFSDYHISERLAEADHVLQEKLPNILLQLGFLHEASLTKKGVAFSNLSRGQRGRVALALSQVQDKPIFLLDEWAADQDPEARAYFYGEILPMLRKQGKTGILISHDDRYFFAADRVIALHDTAGGPEMKSASLEHQASAGKDSHAGVVSLLHD